MPSACSGPYSIHRNRAGNGNSHGNTSQHGEKFTATYPTNYDVRYRLETEIGDGRLYPVDILSVWFQGVEVTRALYVEQFLDFQREIFNSLTNEQKGKWAGFVGPYRAQK